ncbi:MAG: hypothetical protein V4494_03990 [Chlamydiota bacterium]
MKAIFLCILFFSFSLQAVIQRLPEKEPRKVFILTIPKSGSHLIEKAVQEITHREVKMLPYKTLWTLPRVQELEIDDIIHWTHFYKEADALKNVDPNKYIKIINIRDPRDVIISQRDMANRRGNWARWTPPHFFDDYFKLSQEDRLSFSIYFPDKYDSVKVFLDRALAWVEDPDVFICRFEDLVGPQGGGDRLRQENTLRGLAHHLGYSIEEDDIKAIADNLFGNTEMFNKGQIGRWRELYTPKHKMEFNEVMGDRLIKLGYEEDLNW